MSPVEAWRVALDALRASRLRSALTMVGVVVGVAAVVILVAIGTGTKQKIEQQVEGLGSNLLLIVPGQVNFGAAPTVSRLRLDDVDAVTRIVGDRGRVAVATSLGGDRTGGHPGAVQLGRRGAGDHAAGLRALARQGDLPQSLRCGHRAPGGGARLDGGDVAVRGAGPGRLPDHDRRGAVPGGRRVRAARPEPGRRPRRRGAHPITTAQRVFDTARIDAMAVKAPDRASLAALGTRIVTELHKRHPDTEFSAVTQDQILGVLGDILGILTGVLAAIAGISLLVGGVGVSNIMLVSVRERTREIGLRMAVGARPRDIGLQFLLEAVLLTCIGGVVGIGLGAGAALVVGALTPVPAVITWWSIALAFGVSAGVGIIFGVVPAQRAGRLDPVVALRTE
jgi:putative ABC transport system permease protein